MLVGLYNLFAKFANILHMVKNSLIFKLSRILGIISIVIVVCILVLKSIPYPTFSLDSQFVQASSTEGALVYETNVTPNEFDEYLLNSAKSNSFYRVLGNLGINQSSVAYVRKGTSDDFREYHIRSGFNLFGLNELTVTYVPTASQEGSQYNVTIVPTKNYFGGVALLAFLIILANTIVYKKIYKKIKVLPLHLYFVFFYAITLLAVYIASSIWPAFSIIPNADTSHLSGLYNLALYLNGGTYLFVKNLFLESFVWSTLFTALMSLVVGKAKSSK